VIKLAVFRTLAGKISRMKHLSLLFIAFIILANQVFAQRTIRLRTMWARPQVHVLFEGYVVSFTIKDIDKALVLLDETGDHTYGRSCGLDTNGDYLIELYPGLRTEYLNPLQPIIQRAVGAFLLSSGHAYVQNKKHRKLKTITTDIEPIVGGEKETVIKFYDPKKGKILFYGVLPAAMYTKDIGLD
jgi:hypothetical protein